MKRFLVTLLTLTMIIGLCGCANSGQSKEQKQEHYANFFENYEAPKSPFRMTADIGEGDSHEYIEMGINNDLFFCHLTLAGNTLDLYSTDEKAWCKTKISGEETDWFWANLTSGEGMQMYEGDEFVALLEDVKSVTYRETKKENGKEYDILDVVTGEDEEKVNVEVWVCNDKVARLVYDVESMDEQGKDVVQKATVDIFDGSNIKVPEEAEKGTETTEEEMSWAIIGFLFSGYNFEEE